MKILKISLLLFILSVSIPAQNPDTLWTKIIVDNYSEECWGIDCEDFDGDGDMDIIISQAILGRIDWYENDGKLQFISHNIFSTNKVVNSIDAVDLDNDLDMDVVFTEQSSQGLWGHNELHVLVNNGQNNFEDSLISVDAGWNFKIIDINQDNFLDIVINNDSKSNSVYWFEQNSNHTFTTHLIDDSCGDAYGIDAIDMDRDEDIDIVQGSVNTDDNLYWYENDGNENYTKHIIDNNVDDPLDLICADIDQDNDVDIVVPVNSMSSYTGELRWYENDGTQQFNYNVISDTAGIVWFMGVKDLDNNNTPDIIASYRDTTCLVWFSNDGNQQFTEFTIDDSVSCPTDFVFTDFNNDGLVDIALLSGSCLSIFQNDNPQLTIYINTLKPSFIRHNDKNTLNVKDYILTQNYPNPFNPTTKISWQSPVGSWQTLKIYDVLGNEVVILVDEYRPAGTYELTWSAADLPSGIYFYQIRAGDFIQTKKMILLK